MEKKIFSDEEVFEQIKPASRKAYKKCWKEFKEINPEINFEEGRPLAGKTGPCARSTSLPASQPSWAWQAGLGGLRLSLKTV